MTRSGFAIAALKKRLAVEEARLEELLPSIGSVWCWEPLKAHAQEIVVVVAVDRERMTVCTAIRGTDKMFWNDLSRFMEACVLISPPQE